MANIFENAIRTLAQQGVADILVPFFLIFTIVYAALEKTNLFGFVNKVTKSEGGSATVEKEDKATNKAVNVVISLAISFAAVFQHVLYPRSPFDVIPILNNALPWIGLLLVAFLVLHVLFTVFTGREFALTSTWWMGLIALIVVYVFVASSETFLLPFWLQSIFYNGAFIHTIIAILIFVGVIAYVIKGSGGDSE